MKVGTDGVLLGAWVEVRPTDGRILDIGTGTGLIALMLAQRTETQSEEAHITGIDADDVSQARENADASPWGARLAFVRLPVQEFYPDGKYDLIVSNPPYFVDSLTCPDPGRTLARHAGSLPYEALCETAVRLLAPGGRFAVILPTEGAARFLSICGEKLALRRRTDVRTTPRHPAKRVLMEFSAASAEPAHVCASVASTEPARAPIPAVHGTVLPSTAVTDELVIGTGVHEQYTEAYRTLTQDFYLKF